MGQEELHFKLEEIAPGVELAPVMAALKTMQRVTFNANNGVFSYKVRALSMSETGPCKRGI